MKPVRRNFHGAYARPTARRLFRLRRVLCGRALPIARQDPLYFAFGRYMAARLFRLAGKTGAVPLFRLRHKTSCIPARRHSNGFVEFDDPDGLPDLGPVLY